MAISSSSDLLSAVLKVEHLDAIHDLLVQHQALITEDFLENVDQLAQQSLDSSDSEVAVVLINIGRDASGVVSNDYYSVRFLVSGGQALAQSGQLDDAASLFEKARSKSEELVKVGDPIAPRLLLAVGQHLGKLEMDRGNPSLAVQRLLETLEHLRGLGSSTAQLWIYASLIDAYLAQDDVESATQYAQLLAQAYLQRVNESAIWPPDASAVCGQLFPVIDRLYYQKEALEEAAAIASLAIQICPDAWNPFFYLGVSQLALKRYAEAAETWRRAIEAGHKKPAAYFNYASALSQLDRLDETLSAADAAIELAPTNARYYFQRGLWLKAAGKQELAVTDFTKTVDLCETQPSGQPAADEPRSMLEYRRTMPGRDLAEFARLERINSERALNRLQRAEEDIEFLILNGDAVSASAAQVARGELREATQDYADAEAAYTAALELNPNSSEGLVHRADLRRGHGRLEEAVSDLNILADRNRDPELAVDRLSQILREHPGLGYILKARGRAYLEAWRPSLAVADLTAALKVMPPDAEMLLTRGLAFVTTSPLPEEEAWNETLSPKRILDAIQDLASALELAPENRTAQRAIRWIVDRAIGDDFTFEMVVGDGGEDGPIFRALPDFREPALRFRRGILLGYDRQWKEAIAEHTHAQAGFLKAGLPVMAARVHLPLADNYLRLYELQMAFDHIQAAEEGEAVVGRPLSEKLEGLADRQQTEAMERTGSKTVAIEFDYLGLYGIGYEGYARMLRLLKAQAHARVGNLDRALESLGDINDLGDTFEAKISAATILRDAEHYEEGLRIINGLFETEMTDRQRIWLLVTVGTVYGRLGLAEEAVQSFESARQLAQQSEASDLAAILINEAANLKVLHRTDDALRLLDTVDIDRVAPSDFHVYTYYVVRAQVLLAANRLAEAQIAAGRALSIAEEKRLELRMPEARMAWQGKVEEVYELGVRSTEASGNSRAALELTERSRSRAFLDQLEAGHLPLPQPARHLQDLEAKLMEIHGLLMQLNRGLTIAGPGYLEPEILRRLRKLDAQIDLLEPATDRPRRLSPERIASELDALTAHLRRIHGEIDEARAEAASTFAGSPLAVGDLTPLLTLRQAANPAA